ncbi:hypothetical protein PO909_018601, partial [Leuciscus waleckii]
SFICCLFLHREKLIHFHFGSAVHFVQVAEESVYIVQSPTPALIFPLFLIFSLSPSRCYSLYCLPSQRLPAKNVYYYRCPDHRRNYVMSFAFCFDREDDVYQFAYCYPYTYSRLQHYLASLERRNLDYLQREQLGLSVVSHCMFAHLFL